MSEGAIPTEVRRLIADHALALSLGQGQRSELPADLEGYVREVTMRPYQVGDAEISALKEAGYSEDAIFELTISAALGAALARLDQGLAALAEVD